MNLDLSRYPRPEMLGAEELESKLDCLSGVLDRRGLAGLFFSQEGAMRWLTGTRHQVADMAPNAESPVQALVVRKGDRFEITLVTTPVEMPRVKDQVPPVFKDAGRVTLGLSAELPSLPRGVLAPGAKGYAEAVEETVRPLAGGLEGAQYKKLEWLAAMTTAVMAETAHQLEPGMNGAQVRGRLFRNMAERDLENNIILVALEGQETHLHPLYSAHYSISPNSWVKLVTGGRYADLIVSATLMIKFGAPPSEAAAASYRALQEGLLEYADCYRNRATEAGIYEEIGRRFQRLEKKHGLPGFAKAAYLHHLGGPTSPLGNRDYTIQRGGTRAMFPWMQFAINPVEPFHNLKVEIQGIVMPDGAPRLLDISRFTPPDLLGFSDVSAEGGTRGKVAEIIQR